MNQTINKTQSSKTSPAILITGANRGQGLEFVRQYAADGSDIWACCRNPDKADELHALAKKFSGHIRIHRLDVTDFAAVNALSQQLKEITFDMVINNAGVFGDSHHNDLENFDPQKWLDVFRANTIAPLVVARAFLPHAAKSTVKKFIFITSKMGSITDNTSGGYYTYRSSKAALNMAVKSFALDTAPQKIIAVVFHPGWVQTDMGGSQAPLKPETSITAMKSTIAKMTLEQSGEFLNYNGERIPW